MPDLSSILADLMAGLTFFRQERVDGGIRTGIMLGVITVFETFEGYEDPYDPSLAWSIDLRCNGHPLPQNATEAREWLLAHGTSISEGFERFAEHLCAGADPTGIFLLEWSEFSNLPEGVTMKIVCGALRRIDALFLASRLRDVGENWIKIVSELHPDFHEAY